MAARRDKRMTDDRAGERCPNCGAKAVIKREWIECPERTCQAFKQANGKWTPGYGGEQTPRLDDKP